MKSARRPVKVSYQETEQVAWHSFALGDVFAHLGSKRDGLSGDEAKMRIRHFGANEIPEKNRLRAGKIFAGSFLNPFFGIAIASASLAMFAEKYVESAVVFGLLVFGCAIGFFQKLGIEKYLEKISRIESKIAVVLRDGVRRQMPASEIVPGDVIIFRAGDEIPADARIIQSFGLKMAEGNVTGIDSEISKNMSAVSAGAGISERMNTVYGKTIVLDGSGEAVVFSTGRNMEIYKTKEYGGRIPRDETLFEKKISKLSKLTVVLAAASSIAVFAFGFLNGKEIQESFEAVSAVLASAVLLILPIAGFSALFCGAGRILSKKGLVRSLSIAESIGGISVLIADKSGIFTEKESKIAKILTPERRSGILELSSTAEYASNHLLALTYCALVAGPVAEEFSNDSQTASNGNKIETALAKAAISAGLDVKKLEKKFKNLGSMPFGGERRFSISFRETPEGERWAFIVGYADALLSGVKKIQVLNRYENAIPFELGVIKESVEAMAKNGLSVFAVCSKKIENRENLFSWIGNANNFRHVSDLNLVGLMGIKDEIIKDSQVLLSEGRRDGIRTVIVTSDNPIAAKSFGMETGVVPKNRVPEILEGKDIEAFGVMELSHRIGNTDIFSRTTPDQKLKIVRSWKEQGESICVFGDSPGDSASIREANVGVSAIEGADSAKNASGMIILDGGIKTLFDAVKEGRAILENIRKIFVYILSMGITESVLIGIGIVFGFQIPVIAPQILWANIIVGIFPASALARKEFGVSDADSPALLRYTHQDLRPEKEKRKFMGSREVLLSAIAGFVNAIILFGMFLFFKSSFNSVSYAQSVTFLALSIVLLFTAFSSANLSRPVWETSFNENKSMLAFCVIGILITASSAYIGPLSDILGSSAVGFLEWVIIFGAGVLGFLAVEMAKWGLTKRNSKLQNTNPK